MCWSTGPNVISIQSPSYSKATFDPTCVGCRSSCRAGIGVIRLVRVIRFLLIDQLFSVIEIRDCSAPKLGHFHPFQPFHPLPMVLRVFVFDAGRVTFPRSTRFNRFTRFNLLVTLQPITESINLYRHCYFFDDRIIVFKRLLHYTVHN